MAIIVALCCPRCGFRDSTKKTVFKDSHTYIHHIAYTYRADCVQWAYTQCSLFPFLMMGLFPFHFVSMLFRVRPRRHVCPSLRRIHRHASRLVPCVLFLQARACVYVCMCIHTYTIYLPAVYNYYLWRICQ